MTTLTVTVPTGFDAALAAFVSTTQARLDAEYARNYSLVKAPILTVDKGGQKYLRIVANDTNGSRHVFCFVRVADGAVLKAAGWKAPAKHARGSIYAHAGQDAITSYGAKYLR